MRPLSVLTAVAAAFAVAFPAPAQAQDDLAHELQHVERALWHGWATHDVSPFEEHVVENAVNVGPWGTTTGKAALLQEIASHPCTLEDAQFADWKANKVSDGTVILTYTAVQKGSCEGSPLPEKVAVSSVYVRHGDHWMSASYHETPLIEP